MIWVTCFNWYSEPLNPLPISKISILNPSSSCRRTKQTSVGSSPILQKKKKKNYFFLDNHYLCTVHPPPYQTHSGHQTGHGHTLEGLCMKLVPGTCGIIKTGWFKWNSVLIIAVMLALNKRLTLLQPHPRPALWQLLKDACNFSASSQTPCLPPLFEPQCTTAGAACKERWSVIQNTKQPSKNEPFKYENLKYATKRKLTLHSGECERFFRAPPRYRTPSNRCRSWQHVWCVTAVCKPQTGWCSQERRHGWVPLRLPPERFARGEKWN